MKIKLYENYITNQAVLNEGIVKVKEALASIKFPLVLDTQKIEKQFTSILVNKDDVNGGYLIQPNEIGLLASVDRNYDGWFLFYDADRISPKPNGNSIVYHPAATGQLMQMPCQWYGDSSDVFVAFFLHELVHLKSSESGTRDLAHLVIDPSLDPALYDKYIARATSYVPYYLYLLETMKAYWGTEVNVPVVPPQSQSEPVLRRGSKGEAVKILQRLLGGLVVDGDFGRLTEKVVKAYQYSKGLVPDGIVGKLTWLSLKKKPKSSLIEAIIQVESAGDDNAIGDRRLKHPAYGSMQIRQPLVDDVNRRFGMRYISKDCLGNRMLSVDLFNKYFKIYDHNKTDEQKSRAWNGGGNWQKIYNKKGYEKYSKALDAYWGKIKVLL